MIPTLFPAIMFVDWSINRQSKDGKEHIKKVRSRAAKQGWKKRKSNENNFADTSRA